MSDLASAVDGLVDRVLTGAGALDATLRQAAASGGGLPPLLAGYVDKVHRHAYRVLDEDVEALVAAGLSERQVFELTHAAAFGAGRKRLAAALASLNEEL